jgi:hypothetical protein
MVTMCCVFDDRVYGKKFYEIFDSSEMGIFQSNDGG